MKNKVLAFMICGAMVASMAGCNKKDTNNNQLVQEQTSQEESKENVKIQLGHVYSAPHGTKGFAIASAVVCGNTILDAYIDEFQFFNTEDDVVGVPNSDSDFGAGYSKGNVLGTKRENSDYYSNLMKERAGSTVKIDDNFDAIVSYVKGKTIEELEADIQKEDLVDAVSGATLADTSSYIATIIDAAKNALNNEQVEFTGDISTLRLNTSYGAPHGTKSFAVATTLVSEQKIELSYIDEFQFMEKEDGIVGVPNSDAEFSNGYAEGQVLASKRMNAEYYSNLMKEIAGSTVSIDKNYDAIQNHLNGMSIDQAIEFTKNENQVDAISGATLADTAGYVSLIVETARK